VLSFLDTTLFVCKMREIMKEGPEQLPDQKTEAKGSRIFKFFRDAQELSRATVHGALENDEPNNGQADVAPTTTIPNLVFRQPSL
jgi:hypothetical protein